MLWYLLTTQLCHIATSYDLANSMEVSHFSSIYMRHNYLSSTNIYVHTGIYFNYTCKYDCVLWETVEMYEFSFRTACNSFISLWKCSTSRDAKTMHVTGFLTNVQAIIIVAPPHLLVFCVINWVLLKVQFEYLRACHEWIVYIMIILFH